MRAISTACMPSATPAPVNWFQPRPAAARVSTSPTCSEASRGSACHASAASPDTIGAAKLVPSP